MQCLHGSVAPEERRSLQVVRSVPFRRGRGQTRVRGVGAHAGVRPVRVLHCGGISLQLQTPACHHSLGVPPTVGDAAHQASPRFRIFVNGHVVRLEVDASTETLGERS